MEIGKKRRDMVKRMTFLINKNLHHKLRLAAAKKNTSMTQEIHRALTKHIKTEEKYGPLEFVGAEKKEKESCP